MDCNSVRKQIEDAFDEGVALSRAVIGHLATCDGCAAHQHRLHEFDALLQTGPELVPDPELVARIQASIAGEPAMKKFPWNHVAAAAAAIAALTGAGSFIDTGHMLTRADWSYWLSAGPVIPEWQLMQSEAMNLPVALLEIVQTSLAWLGNAWAHGAVAVSGLFGEEARWLWPGFVACLVIAVALNLTEVRRRHHNNEMQTE